jgi:hypothetical protein
LGNFNTLVLPLENHIKGRPATGRQPGNKSRGGHSHGWVYSKPLKEWPPQASEQQNVHEESVKEKKAMNSHGKRSLV